MLELRLAEGEPETDVVLMVIHLLENGMLLRIAHPYFDFPSRFASEKATRLKADQRILLAWFTY